MRIDGRKIADTIKQDLRIKIQELREKEVTPKIAIITLGDEGSWEVYVRQKLKIAAELGIKAVLLSLEDADDTKLLSTIEAVDSDPTYHGIIVQRPLIEGIDRGKVINAISRAKDIDGFRNDSPFEVPLWLAVKRLTEESLRELDIKRGWSALSITVIGKGETGGGPVIEGFRSLGAAPQVIDSKTADPTKIIKKSDIIVSCVGKKEVIKSSDIKKGAILIGVGVRGEDGKAYGDYEEEDVADVPGTYTPTPGGVGPVNLAYLYKNLIDAAQNSRL